MTMRKFYFRCPKCGRTITAMEKEQAGKKFTGAFELRCFTRAGVGCGKWAALLGVSKAFRSHLVHNVPMRIKR